MYQISEPGLNLVFDLKPGRYVFLPDSATGKTYLGKLMLRAFRKGYPVRVYTHDDWLAKTPIPNHCKVLLLDRLDMYTEAYKQLPDDVEIILMDYKGIRSGPFACAEISFTVGSAVLWA